MRKTNQGFTLIELMIVIGIIVVLMAVLAVAIFPMISRSNENGTKALLQQIGGAMNSKKGAYSVKKFQKDIGSLSKALESDPKKRSSQMMLFYVAPTERAWNESKLYKGKNYAPEIDPVNLKESIMNEESALPYLADAWGTTLWYKYDKGAKTMLILSAGEDRAWDTEDDLVYDGRSDSVKFMEEITK